jgi:hypothetical protein
MFLCEFYGFMDRCMRGNTVQIAKLKYPQAEKYTDHLI